MSEFYEIVDRMPLAALAGVVLRRIEADGYVYKLERS